MKRTILALALLFAPAAVFAQPKPAFIVVHEEIVPPAMVARYETLSKEFVSMLAAKNIADPNINFSTFMTPDFHYLFVSRLPGGLAGYESMFNSWMSLPEKIGKDKWADFTGRSVGSMNSYNEVLAMRRDDLSYAPAAPRLKPEEQGYVHWQFYYLVPGKESEAEAIARDYAALFKAKNMTDPFTVYLAMNGNDLPLLVVATTGKSAADYAVNDDRVNAMLGNDVRPLQARALAITRKFETREGWYRPDLSYPAPPKPAAK